MVALEAVDGLGEVRSEVRGCGSNVVGESAVLGARSVVGDKIEKGFDGQHKERGAERAALANARADGGARRGASRVPEHVGVVAVEEAVQIDHVTRDADGQENVPQEIVSDTRERGREIEKDRGALAVLVGDGGHGAVDVQNVIEDLPPVEKATLGGADVLVGDGGQ